MGNTNKNMSFTVDGELLLQDGTAMTATVAGKIAAAAQVLDLGDESQWPTVYGQFDVELADYTTTDETYELAIESSDTSAFTIVQARSSVKLVAAETGHYVVAHQPVGRYVRAYFTLAGTTPSITLEAFLAVKD